jgi:hypothetical protein
MSKRSFKLSSTVKYGALLVVLILTFVIIIRAFFCETYEDVIDLVPGRTCPPDGYERGQCPDPTTYDWTKGDCVLVDEGPIELRLRWNGNNEICACIPMEWQPSSVHKMMKRKKENPHFQ